jgi:hypothetical protein
LNNRVIALIGSIILVVVVLSALLLQEPGGNGNRSWNGFFKFDFLPGVEGKFADYSPIQMTYLASVAPYAIEAGRIRNLDDFNLGSGEIEMLERNGFFAAGSRYEEMYELYQEMRDRNVPIFVTTDSMLHAYHVLYDYVLRQAEHSHFADRILELTRAMADSSAEQYHNIEYPEIKEAARLNLAYFTVAGLMLDPDFPVPGAVREEVKAEADLISAHEGFSISPIFGVKEDYSQYVPRGHYTRSEKFKAYFKAMMWYGRITFTLRMSSDPADIEIGRRHTRQALLIIGTLDTLEVDGDPAIDVWSEIYEPTAFFVGEMDDLDLYDYADLSSDVFGGEVRAEALAGNDLIDDFISGALELPEPKISSTGSMKNMQGFRFMGQRFIPDSYMFQELVYDKTSRMMPKGLDVMSVLGSQRAWEHLEDEWDEANYREQMAKLVGEFGDLTIEEWTQNLYWLWIYTLKPLLTERDGNYPTFMLSEAWTDKELMTALGSWTELRHDTILYAKQSYTLESAMPNPELTKGYVEPNPELYGRLASLARMTREGLVSRGLLSEEFEDRLSEMEELSMALMEISGKELQNEDLSEEEYETIWNIGNTLERLVTAPAEMAQMTTDADTKMPVVVDVHTDPNSGLVLEEGTGYPMELHVVVEIDGKLFITVGASFAYHEFTQPMSGRLTDEAWQEMLDSGQGPELPSWASSFT